jgi:hypothetical protein
MNIPAVVNMLVRSYPDRLQDEMPTQNYLLSMNITIGEAFKAGNIKQSKEARTKVISRIVGRKITSSKQLSAAEVRAIKKIMEIFPAEVRSIIKQESE